MGENALITTISCAGTLLLLNRLRACAVDHFRQDMFSLRNKLFDLAASGELDFRHPAYETLRAITNGFIRSAHEIKIFSPLSIFAARKARDGDSQAEEFERSWIQALRELPGPTREKLSDHRRQVHRAFVLYLVYGSPALLLTVIVPLGILVVGAVAWFAFSIVLTDRVLSYCTEPLKRVDSHAVQVGDDNSLAIAI